MKLSLLYDVYSALILLFSSGDWSASLLILRPNFAISSTKIFEA